MGFLGIFEIFLCFLFNKWRFITAFKVTIIDKYTIHTFVRKIMVIVVVVGFSFVRAKFQKKMSSLLITEHGVTLISFLLWSATLPIGSNSCCQLPIQLWCFWWFREPTTMDHRCILLEIPKKCLDVPPRCLVQIIFLLPPHLNETCSGLGGKTEISSYDAPLVAARIFNPQFVSRTKRRNEVLFWKLFSV